MPNYKAALRELKTMLAILAQVNGVALKAEEGRWITTDSGAHVFIASGQSVSDALGERFGSDGEVRPRMSIENRTRDMGFVGGSTSEANDFVKRAAKELDFDESKISVSDQEPPTFVLDGVTYPYAGAYNPQTDTITLYKKYATDVGTKANARGIVAHEVQHARNQVIENQLRKENNEMFKVYGAMSDAELEVHFTKAGYPKSPEMRARFPTVDAIDGAVNRGEFPPIWELQKKDGITDYSAKWWKAVENKTASAQRAFDETLSEVAYKKLSGEDGGIPREWRQAYSVYSAQYKRIKKAK